MTADLLVANCIVRPQRRIVERGGVSVHVKPKSMSVFECLVAAGGKPVTRNELFDKVWPGGEITDDTLTKCIVELRKAFGDSARESRVIETIPKLGFRLVPPVEPLEPGQSSAENQQPFRRKWRRPRAAAVVFFIVALVFGTSLAVPGSRLWLTEAGTTWAMKTVAMISPYGAEIKPGIAVLPFVNMSGDPENEYFSDGMSAEVLNSLARTARLPVIARSSAFQFKGQPQDIKEIGRLLGVTHVLEGSVRKDGNSIRMTVHLIDSATGALVWSGAYQRELSDVFSLQQEIAENIVANIDAIFAETIAPPPAGLPAAVQTPLRHTSNLEAYELYLKGMQMLMSDRPALVNQASSYFDRAIALDGNYADAWAAKGMALLALGSGDSGSPIIPASIYPDAIAALRSALEIEPGHALATGWLGMALMVNDFNWAEGMRLLEESLAQNPNDANLLAVYGFYMSIMQLEGAGEVLERAYRLDPFSSETIMDLALQLEREGRLLDALTLAETALIQDREGYAVNYFAAGLNLRLGRLDVAEERLQKARLVANPVDLNLDALQWLIDSRRGTDTMPSFSDVWERMQTEKLNSAVLWDGWETEEEIVAVFDLAIKQRIPALRTALFGSKPAMMPDADWRRIKDMTGVTQFQATR